MWHIKKIKLRGHIFVRDMEEFKTLYVGLKVSF